MSACEIVFTREDINSIVQRVADKLNEEFSNSTSIPVFIGVLKGALPFMMDLIKKCTFDLKTDFIDFGLKGVYNIGKS